MKENIREMSEPVIQEKLRGIKIPTPPQIIVDLQIEMANPDFNISDIEQIIVKDIGISGKVIKLINSPFFGLRNRVTSIKNALNLLGVTNICNIINSIAITERFSACQLIEMTRFWDNSTDIAITAAAISRLMGIALPDETYTLGLFHNVGIALLMEKYCYYSDILKQAYGQGKYRITDIENHNINCNHAVVGNYVARSWKLPIYIAEAIADHHNVLPILTDKVNCEPNKKDLLAVLKLAENICQTHKVIGDEENDYEFDRIKMDLFFYLDISDYDYEEITAEVTSKYTIGSEFLT